MPELNQPCQLLKYLRHLIHIELLPLSYLLVYFPSQQKCLDNFSKIQTCKLEMQWEVTSVGRVVQEFECKELDLRVLVLELTDHEFHRFLRPKNGNQDE